MYSEIAEGPEVSVSGVSKCYSNGVQALDDVTLKISSGVFGLLGKNGAGKSTLMRTLATLQAADSGEARLGEIDLLTEPMKARRRIGYLPQDMGVYPNVSARETLQYFAGLKGLGKEVDVFEELARVNLDEVADQRLDTFSGGMKRRFGIAVAFLGCPDLVIVDEPTAGLDPFERRRFQHFLLSAAENCVLILSSHIVEDVADLASGMAILHEGKVVADGPPEALVEEIRGKVWSSGVERGDIKAWEEKVEVLSWRPEAGGHRIRVLASESPGPGFVAVEPDLEDLYACRVGGNRL
ncbi:MAG: ATP-binding cassette domain-containing protein [Verrucomicrobiota bacterium]